MAKRKGNRPKVSQEALARARAELLAAEVSAQQGGTAAAATPSVAQYKPAFSKRVVFKKAVSVEELKAEYSYVIADLRSMFLLAVALMVLLVVVALVFV